MSGYNERLFWAGISFAGHSELARNLLSMLLRMEITLKGFYIKYSWRSMWKHVKDVFAGAPAEVKWLAICQREPVTLSKS